MSADPTPPKTVGEALALAIEHHRGNRLAEAEVLYRQILAVAPDHPDALHLLGEIAHRVGREDIAFQLVSRSIAVAPQFASPHITLGEVHRTQGRLDEAMACYQRALAIQPNIPEAHTNMGIVYAHRCQVDESLKSFRRAIELQPDIPEAHDGLGLTLLLNGDLPNGFREQEWRWKKRGFPSPKRQFDKPMWDGSDPSGRTILVHAEQGFGDTIQFCRYVPILAKQGAKVIVACQPELYDLLKTLDGVDQLVLIDTPLPPFDVHCPMLSLPMLMGTTLETIPAEPGYLRADEQRVAKWRGRLGGEDFKVGIAWAGSTSHANDLNRSMTLELFAPLADVPGVRLFSLQKGQNAVAQLKASKLPITDLSTDLNDFADTAAAISCLDLIIAVDTSVVHVAGVLGKPVWTMVAFMPDWRWLLNRTDTPWYPTMKLFRQPTRGDWASVMSSVVRELEELAGGKVRC